MGLARRGYLRRELGDKRAIAEALNDLAMTVAERRDYDRSAALHEESLTLFRELGERRGIAVALTNLGRVLNDRAEYARATALHEEALTLFRELGDTANIAYVLENLPLPLTEQGDYARAMALLDECLTLRRALGEENLLVEPIPPYEDTGPMNVMRHISPGSQHRALTLRTVGARLA